MSATALYPLRGGPINVKYFASLYTKTFDAVVKRMDEDEPAEGLSLFGEEDTNLSTWKIGEVSSVLDIPLINSDSDRVPLVSPVEGYPKTFTPVQRRSGFIVTREAVEAQKFRLINSMLTGLPASFKSLKELLIATFFANSFTSETTGDGSYVFATDHYYEDARFGTWSNTPASGAGISTTTLMAAWSSMHGRKNAKGRPTPMNPGELVYYYTQHEDVMKVLGSSQYPQNALNANLPEFLKDFTPKPMHWFTDTNDWFVRAKEDKRDPAFKIVYSARETYLPISDSLNPDLIMGRRGRVSLAIGAVHGRTWYGASVS